MMTHPEQLSFQLDTDARHLVVGGQIVPIGARAFDVLAYLDSNRDRVVSKQELLEQVWGALTVEEGNLSVQISTLRKVLGAAAISTVPGVGYKLSRGSKAAVSLNKPLPLPQKPSLAVLPFANLTGDISKDFLVDGIVSDLISALTRIPAFFVIAASSTFALKGQNIDLAEIGERLGVRYILEGGIQSAGDQLRINTQLVEAATGRTIWSARFAGVMADLFALQDDFTAQVSAALEPNLMLAEARLASRTQPRDLDSYTLCLRAAPRVFRMADRESFETGTDLLHRALEFDPEYIEAKSLLCRAHMMACAARFIDFPTARTLLPMAEDLLAAPDVDATTLALAGHFVAYLGHEFQRGINAVTRAVALNPHSSMGLIHSGWVHSYVGEADTAMAHFRQSMRLNPIDPRNPQIRSGLGIALITNNRFEDAVIELEAAYAAAPAWATSFNGLIICYASLGRMEEARKFRDLLLASAPNTTLSDYLRDTPHQNPVYLEHLERSYRAVGLAD